MLRRMLRVIARGAIRLVLVLVVVELIIYAGLWSIGHDTCLEPDPQTGWRVRPNIQRAFNGESGPYLVETNSRGMRDVEHSYERKDGVYRIVTLGACGTFGLGVEERDSYVSKIEEFLPNTETVNLGAIGFSADQELILLTKEGLRYHPDLVIQFLIKQDGRAIFYPWSPVMGTKPYLAYDDSGGISMQSPTPQFWELALNLTHLPWLLSSIDGWHEPFFSRAMPSNEDRFRGLAQLLFDTRAACEKAGADYLAVFVPEPSSVHTYSQFGDSAKTLTPRLVDYMQQQNTMHTLDLMDPMLAATQDTTQPEPFAKGDQSLSPAGHEIVARCVTDEIRASRAFQTSRSQVMPRAVASSGD